MGKELYTVGHSNHTLETFLGLLRGHEIQAICDVRSAPYSAYTPHFNREPLREALKRAGIQYGYRGKELGGRADDPSCYAEGQVQYDRLADTTLFRHGLARLQRGMETRRIALMCSEKVPLMCHRTILVCRHLRSADLTIKHILETGDIELNTESEARLMRLLRIQPDLFTSPEELIEQAYDRQSKKIAYTVPPKGSVIEEVEA